MNAGILGMGAAFPEEVKTNDWWAPDVVGQWEARTRKDITKPELRFAQARSDAQRIQFEQMAETYGDPFRGSIRRRVAPAQMPASELQIAAAREALAQADVDPADVSLVLESALPADRIHPGNGVLIAKALGLRRATALTVDSGCSAFLAQLSLADAMINSGQAKYVLISNAAIFSRLIDWNDPTSVNFGDGAGAAVVGPVPAGFGFLAHASRTKPDFYDGVIVAPRDCSKRWYDAGEKTFVGSANVDVGRAMVLSVAEDAKDGIETVLRKAGLEKDAITHYYAHQAVSFFGSATRLASGLGHTTTTDTFREYGNVSAASVMVNLWKGASDGQLRQGDSTVLFAIGPGMNWMASVLKWAKT